jgi:DNA-binding transcriptional regulator YdaS (Cro superfamily)
MNLPDYIKAIGHEAAAKAFGVSESAIKSWRWGARRPRPDKAHEIEAVTGGRVRFADIYPRPDRANTD